MVFASIGEHASIAIFFWARAEKKICFASKGQFREYNSQAVSTYIFRLQQSIWKSFSLE